MSLVYSPAVSAFRKLHESGCFVLPNPWDIGTARALHELGYKALATTSAGFAFTRGLPDSVTALSLDDVLAHFKEIVEATALPVNADFQHGYADDPEGVAANVKRCVDTGVAGLSIEDATGNSETPLYDRDLAIERIKAAREAIDDSGTGVVLTARCEAFLLGIDNAREIVIDRLLAFAETGADCLYAPDVTDPKIVKEIVELVAPKPVNVIVSSSMPGFTVQALADMGVRRISVGSAMARVAWGAFLKSSREILKTGKFDSFGVAASFGELNGMFESK